MSLKIEHTVLDRFLRYVIIDTQSDAASKTIPSTEKQKNLGKLLVKELKSMGVADAKLDKYGYVYATIPATSDKQVPVICFCSHMDTSPDCSGENVKPIVHKNYQGQDLVLPDDTMQVIRLKDHPNLADQIGNDVVTASGTTLLGADNKAGVAEIMDATNFLMANPSLKHGEIKILFTPDEEIGRGVDKVNLKKLGAKFAYTVDGEKAGSLEDETFSADAVVITIHGVSAHPGYAKGKMENAIKIASEIVAALPKDKLTPESTSGRDGFVHPVVMDGMAEKATIRFIIRDFEDSKLKEHADVLRKSMEKVLKKYPNSHAEFKVIEQYRNMKKILDQEPAIMANAIEGIKRAGLKPIPSAIRGGTDGSRLSYMGLPCPNIFAGEHAFHSKHEWVSVQDMEAAVRSIVHIALVWEEKS
jgi:tripeptide aminopeptidase